MEGSEKKNKFSLAKLISISVSLVVVVAVAVFFLLNGKDSFTSDNNEENTIALSRMALSVGNEIDVDLGELNELDVKEISYSSKDENVAKINEKGVITAVNSGETDIVVVYTVDDVTYEKNVNVVVSSRSSGDFSMSDEIILDYTFDDGVKENVWTDKNVRINVSSNAKVKYTIDCNDNCNYVDLLENGAINVTTEGEHVVTIVAYDNNENSVVKKVNVKIDKTKPTCKFVKGPTLNRIYVGETATYIVDCVDENSRLKVVNDIPFLDVELPKVFTFTEDSIVEVVKETYQKTKKTAISVKNIDDGYRYIVTVSGLKAGKTRIELPQNIFADYAGNLQNKIVGGEITVLDKDTASDYLYCNLSYEKGVITGRGVSSSGLAYYGFSSSYSGSNETTLNVGKTGTYYYYVKDIKGNTRSCKIEISKKDLLPTCSLKYDEKERTLIGSYNDISGSGMSYYGFSSTYSGTNTTKLVVKKSGTYYFYIKDNNGNTAVCEEDVKIPLENPSCKLSYENGVLIGSSYDTNGFGISYEGFDSSYSGTSEYTQNISKPGTYYYYVKDNNGMTGSCSTVVTESMLKKIDCNLTVDKKGDALYIYGSTFDSDGSYYSYYGFSSSYSGAKQNSMKITRGATYTYYVMDKHGNKGSCSIDTTDKPSCSLSFADQGTNGCVYLNVNTKKGTKYGAEIVHGNFVGVQGNVNGNNIVKVCGQKKYTYLVMDAIGNTGTCSIDLTDKPTCSLTVEVPKYSSSVTSQSGVVIKASYQSGSKNYPISGVGFVKYDATFEKVVSSPGTYQYYVKDVVGNEGSCSITVDAKYFNRPSCTLTYDGGILTGKAIDGTGSGLAYYGFSRSYSGSSTSTLAIEKAGTYTFYVKDNYGYVASCSTKVTKEIIEIGGKICSSGSYYDNGTCKTCPVGSYCDGVAKKPCPTGNTSAAGAGKIESCYMNLPVGHYKQDPEMSVYPSVDKCPKGQYSLGGKVYYGDTLKCTSCPKGTYSASTGASSCTKCPSNYTTTGVGSDSDADCKIPTTCEDGKYLDGTKCKDCPKGSYCSAGVKTNCPTGYTSQKNAGDITKCYIEVKAGHYIAYPASNTMIKCPKGSYSSKHTVYYGQAKACTPCESNTTTKSEGSDSKNDCSIATSCSSGQYLDGTKCKDCPDGYNNSSNATSKSMCYMVVDAGKYVKKSGNKTADTCDIGTYSSGGKVYYGSTIKCTTCPTGYTTNGYGAKSASECSIRSSCSKGAYVANNTCVTCPAGSYCDGITKKTCPVNHTSAAGASAITSCYAIIPAGHYKNDPDSAGSSSVGKCLAGRYSKGGKVYYGDTLSCTPCPQNTYSDSVASSSCKTCAAGTTTSGEGKSSCDVKTICKNGEVLKNGDCKPCPKGSYCISGVANSCPSGYTSDEGATAQNKCYIKVNGGWYLTTANTKNTAKCAKGTYKEDHKVYYGSVSKCNACEGDTTTKGEGADAKNDCNVPTSCPSGQYLDGDKCKTCPGGSYCMNSKKYDCPVGYRNGSSGAKSINDCSIEVKGGSFVGVEKSSYPTKCPKGTYKESHTVSYGKTSSCVRCDDGYTTKEEGSDSKKDCSVATSCKAGKYLDNGKCKDCPNGYTSSDGATGIDKCYMDVAAGKYIKKANDSKATNCEKGKISSGGRVYYGRTSFCTSCPAGKTTSEAGRSECNVTVSCATGEYLDTSSATCKVCTPGYYCSNSKETKCPSGYISDSGSTKQTDCYFEVSGGYFISNPTSTKATVCAKGYYKESHKVTYGQSSSCKKCPEGTTTKYVGSSSSSQCSVMTSCKAGKYLDNGNCKDCPKGYTSADGATSQSNCYMTVAAGTYIKKAKDSSVTACPKGQYNASGKNVYYGQTTSCTPCSQGTYADSTGATSCKTCAAGTTTDGTGKSSCDVRTACVSGQYLENGTCKTCPNGYTSDPGTTAKNKCYITVAAGKYIKKANDSKATNCEKGKISSGGKVYYGSTSFCTSCPAGKTTSGEGKSSCDVSVSCNTGQYLDVKSATCKVCTPGYYCSNSKETKCPSGYTSESGSTKQTDCYLYLEAGYFLAYPTSTQRTVCSQGYYKEAHTVHYGQSSSCKKCPEGTTTKYVGSISSSQCSVMTSCKAGKYLDNGNCKDCPKGYTSADGATSQSNCYMTVAAGTYIKRAKDSSATACPKGQYNASGKNVYYGQTTSCTPCSQGTYTDSTGATSCKTCAAGTTTDGAGKSSCDVMTSCAAGKYLEAGKCKACPSGYTSVAGATDQSECYMTVAAGKYIKKAKDSSATACPKGQYNDSSVKVYYGKTTSCTPCSQGTYAASTGATSCKTCAAGTTTDGTGKSSCDKITACGSGQYLENNKCKTCPSGYTSNPGSIKQSECYMTVAAGKYIKKANASSAENCPKGTYSAGGKVNYGSTSSCTSCPSGFTTSGEGSKSESACSIRSSCSKGAYLDNGICKTCPNGYYCEDGVNSEKCPVNHTSAAGASAITSCYANIPAGYYKSDKNSASNLPKCAKGTYSTSQTVYYGKTSSCTKCPTGKYTDTTGATSCKTCAAGTTTDGEGKTSCDVMTSCSAGTYLDNGKCKDCPKGYTSSAGAIAQNQCYITVTAGKYLKNAKDSKASNCPKGTYTNANSTVYYGNTSSCKTCAAGTTTSGEGMTSCNVQVTCNAGEYVSGTSCKQCPMGSYCNGKTATKCPTGYDSKSGASKQSDCFIYVAAGQYLSYPTGSAKSNCAKGSYSVAHNVNYGSSDSCTKCPSGYTTSGAGAMSSSQCSVLTCVRDESCGCETYNKGYYRNGSHTYNSTCSDNRSNNTTIRNCKSYSTSSSGSSCRWVCDNYVYGNTTCKTYKCCEINKGDDFEFNLINYDFINEMISKTLSGLF